MMSTNNRSQADIIRNYIIEKKLQNSVLTTPFPHVVADDFFPIDLARKIDALFPTIDSTDFDSTSITETLRRYRRSMFTESENKTTLELILDSVFDQELLKHILWLFNIEYNDDFCWGGHYVWDYNHKGCNALQPHVDTKSKVVSLVYYVPVVCCEGGKIVVQEIPGTNLLIKNNDSTFTTYKKVEAKRNRCLIFPRVDNSWHAVDETLQPRRTITVFIVKKSKNTTFACLK